MTRPVVHVLSSGSFLDTTASVFEEAAPGRNVFVGVGIDASRLVVPDTARVEDVGADAAGLARLDELVASSRVAVFHGVTAATAPALGRAPSSVLRVWSGWGGDYYGGSIDRWAGLLAPATRRYFSSTIRPTYWLSRVAAARRYGPVLRAAARAADVFSAPVPEDLAVFRRRFPTFRGRYSQLNYVTLEEAIASGPPAALGRDILLGNSASMTNNHLDVIDRLAAVDLEERRVVAPLSYGDREYAAVVARRGREVLGDRFVPLADFLPLDEYNALLNECGVIVHGAWRQEGLGNILRGLWQGARIVLDPRNPVLEHLRTRGLAVSTLDEVDAGGLGAPLTSDELAAAHAFLRERWSREAVVRNVRALLDLAG